MAEIFRRVEKKYLLNREQYEKMQMLLQEYMQEDQYGKSTICNIYFDSDHYDFISHSIEKPFFKEKVRLRSYNVPTEESKVYLEIKRKCDGVVGKRRIAMQLSEFQQYMKDQESLNSKNPQIKSELDYYFQRYQLKPTMYISYEREAYYQKDNPDFRVTFDHHILARQNDLSLANGAYGKEILNEENYIMEVKTLNAIPLWFVKVLNALQIVPGSFSKYGTAYDQMVLHHAVEKKEEEQEPMKKKRIRKHQMAYAV